MNKGRPREFDTKEALSKAILVFWEKGYRGTSLDDLTEAMEINRPSLYSAFGDKQQLFLMAVDQYRDRYIVPNVRKLLTCENLRDGLTEFLRSMIGLLVEDETPAGCMIACLLSSDCLETEEIRNKLSESIAASDAAFAKLFEKHRKELKRSVEPIDAARLLTSSMQGISIRARSGASKRSLLQIGETLITLLVRSEP